VKLDGRPDNLRLPERSPSGIIRAKTEPAKFGILPPATIEEVHPPLFGECSQRLGPEKSEVAKHFFSLRDFVLLVERIEGVMLSHSIAQEVQLVERHLQRQQADQAKVRHIHNAAQLSTTGDTEKSEATTTIQACVCV